MSQHLPPSLLAEISREFGTPLYVYNADKIDWQYEKLSEAFQHLPAKILYAAKALTNLNVLNHIKGLGAGVDCSSINEVKLALLAGFVPKDILYTSTGIGFDEIQEAVESGVHIHIDSLSNLKKFAEHYGNTYPVGLRLRPNIMAGGNLKISTGHDKSKFGIPVEHHDKILEIVNQYNLDVDALHIHTGSEIKEIEPFLKSVDILFKMAYSFKNIRYIDIGGGFKVPYKPEDTETDIQLLADKLHTAWNEFTKSYGAEPQLWMEPGKFLVSEAGYFITTVNVLKETSATTFAAVDSSFNHLIRPMFYEAWHTIKNISNPEGPSALYSIVGNICETDTFAWQRSVEQIKEGDLLVFLNAGAYGFEMASQFNSRLRPAEVLVEGGNARLIRKRETFEDLTRNQIFK